MAPVLKARVPDVSYHVKQLVKYGLAELVEERPVKKGSAEKIYRATERPLMSTEEVGRLPPFIRGNFAGQVYEKALGDALAGFKEKAFEKRSDWHLTRTPLELDCEGWREILAVHERALSETFEVQNRSKERRAENGEKPAVKVSSSQLCFVISS
jgi:hypothetical protein